MYAISRTPVPADLAWDRYCTGDWWYAEYFLNDDGSRASRLGRYYYDHNAYRPPIVVVLPGGVEFCIDMAPSKELFTGGDGWTVNGSPEEGTLTVAPSINAMGRYHGWLGISGTPPGHLSEDLEGRAAAHREWDAARRALRAAA